MRPLFIDAYRLDLNHYGKPDLVAIRFGAMFRCEKEACVANRTAEFAACLKAKLSIPGHYHSNADGAQGTDMPPINAAIPMIDKS